MISAIRGRMEGSRCDQKEMGDYIRIASIDKERSTNNINFLTISAYAMLSRISEMRSKDLKHVSEMLVKNLIEIFTIERQNTEKHAASIGIREKRS